MGNVQHCAPGTSASCANLIENVVGLEPLDCLTQTYVSICAKQDQNPYSSQCTGDFYTCESLIGSNGNYCDGGQSNFCGLPTFETCGAGLECQFDSYSNACSENLYKCRAPTPSPTKFPTGSPSRAPTPAPVPFSNSRIQFRTKISTGQSLVNIASRDTAGGVLMMASGLGKAQLYRRTNVNDWVLANEVGVSQPGTVTAVAMGDDYVFTGVGGQSAINYYPLTTTATPTFAPSFAPSLAPTSAPTYDRTRVKVEIVMYEYLAQAADYDMMSRWVEMSVPKFYSGEEELVVDPIYFDPENNYTAWVPIDEKRITHIKLSYRVTDEDMLLTKDSFIFRTRLFNEWNENFDAFKNVQRVSIVADRIDCGTLPDGTTLNKWDGLNSEPFCVGGASQLGTACYGGITVTNPLILSYTGGYFEPLKYPGYPTCFYTDALTGGFHKVPNSVSGAGLVGDITVQIEGSVSEISYNNVPETGTNEQDVILKMTNWDYSDEPMVIGRIRAYRGDGVLLKDVKANEINVVGGTGTRNTGTTNRYCKQRLSDYDPTCNVYAPEQGCCVINEYDDARQGKCVGTKIQTYQGVLQTYTGCDQVCARDEACTAYDVEIDQVRGLWTCNLYNKVLPDTIEAFANYQCFISKVPRSVFPAVEPLVSFFNIMGDVSMNCPDLSNWRQDGDRCLVVLNSPRRYEFKWNAPTVPMAKSLVEVEVALPPNTTRISIDMGDTGRFTYVQGFDGRQSPALSAVFYEVTQGGVPLDDGEFAPRAYWDSSTKYLQLKKIDGDVNNFLNLQTTDQSVYPLYSVLCDETSDEQYWNRSALIRNIISITGIDMIEQCDDVTSAFLSADINEFERMMGLVMIRMQDAVNEMGINADADTIVNFESNDPAIEVEQEVFSVIVEVFRALGMDVQCRLWAVPRDDQRVAMELYYQYTFPEVYSAVCDEGQDVQYSLDDVTYQKGMNNAPCVSNAQCKTGFVCTSWICLPANETDGLEMCPEGASMIQPDYYSLVPNTNREYQSCSYEEVYSEEGTGADLWDFDTSSRTFSFDATWEDNKCPVNLDIEKSVSMDYFGTRGNEQECSFWGSDELYDWGFSYRRPMWGFSGDPFACQNSVSSQLWEDYRGYYDRIIPHRPRGMGTVAATTSRGSGNRSPSSFAFKDKDGVENLMGALDAKCAYIPGADWASQQGDLEEQCNAREDCQWHDANRKCVASAEEAERHICVFVDDNVQCDLMGFCKWKSVGGGDAQCYHNSFDTDLVTTEEILASVCPSIDNGAQCAASGCAWDVIVNLCLPSEDELLVGNDLHAEVGYHGQDEGRGAFRRECASRRDGISVIPVILRYGNGPNHPNDKSDSAVPEICLDLMELSQDQACCELYGFEWDPTALFGIYCNVMNPHTAGKPIYNTYDYQYSSHRVFNVETKPQGPDWPLCGEWQYDNNDPFRGGFANCWYQGGEIWRLVMVDEILIHHPVCSMWDTQFQCEGQVGCNWIPNADTCVFDDQGSLGFYSKIYDNLFYVPPKETRADVSKYYNRSAVANIYYDWENHFTEYDMPDSVREEAYEKLNMCDIDSIQECKETHWCQWSYDEFKCEPHRCSYFPLLYSESVRKQNTKGFQDDKDVDELIFASTRPCQRLLGCEEDLLTMNCVNADQEAREWKEIVAEDVAFCSKMYDEYEMCDFQMEGRKTACVSMAGYCVARYPVWSSMTFANAAKMSSQALLELDSLKFLEQYYYHQTDQVYNMYADTNQLQLLDGDEVYYLGGKTFYDDKVTNMLDIFGEAARTTEFPSVKFTNLFPGWPVVMTDFETYSRDFIFIKDCWFYVDDERTQNNRTNVQHELASQLMQEVVDRHRRNSMLVARTLMNAFTELDLVLRMDAEFVYEQQWWPNAKEDLLQMYTGILSNYTSLGEAEAFLQQIAEGDDDLSVFPSQNTGANQGERNIIYTKNMIQGLMAANTVEYMETETGLFDEDNLLDMAVGSAQELYGAFGAFSVVDYDGDGALATLNVFGNYMALVDFVEDTYYYNKLVLYLEKIDTPRVKLKFKTINLKYTEEVTKSKLLFQKGVKINKTPQAFFKVKQSTQTLKAHQSKWVLAAKWYDPPKVNPNFNVAPLDQVPNKNAIKETITNNPPFRGSGAPSSDSVNMGSNVANDARANRIKARQQAMLESRNQGRVKKGKKPLKHNSLSKKSKKALLLKKKLQKSTQKMANLAKTTKHFQSNVGKSKWAMTMFKVHSSIPTDTVKITDTAATLSRKFSDFEFATTLEPAGIQRWTEKVQKSKKLIVPYVVRTKMTKFQMLARKTAKALKVLRIIGEFLGPIGTLMDIIDVVLMIVAYVNAFQEPAFCQYTEEIRNLANPLSYTAVGIFDAFRSGRFWKPFRIFFGGEDDILVGTNYCSQRASYAAFDADGGMGFVDGRYDVPQCDGGFSNSLKLDYHFSDKDTGMNSVCQSDSECKGASYSSIGKCVMGRCVFPVGYIGMKQCTAKVNAYSTLLPNPQNYNYVQRLQTSSIRAGIPEKYTRDDPLQDGVDFLAACAAAATDDAAPVRFVELWWNRENGEIRHTIRCFEDCNAWEVGTNMTRHTYMLKMNEAGLTTRVQCSETSECGEGELCVTGGYCHGPVSCDDHRDCFGAWFPRGRLPVCDPVNLTCGDGGDTTCTTVEECYDESDDLITNRPTAAPTVTRTLGPTGSPSVSPTRSPTLSICARDSTEIDKSRLSDIVRPEDFGPDDNFGSSMEVYGAWSVVGAPKKNESAGAAYIFKNELGVWVQKAKLVGDENEFGRAVAICENVIAVSSRGDGDKGKVFVYEMDTGENWSLLELVVEGTFSGDLMGESLSLTVSSGVTKMAIGSPYWSSIGKVDIYKKNAGSFELSDTIISPLPGVRFEFGAVIDYDGIRVVVGEPGRQTRRANSKAHVFRDVGDDQFILEDTLGGDVVDKFSGFGSSLAVDGNVVVVGAPNADVVACNVVNAGVAYVFYRNETDVLGSWYLHQQFFPPNPKPTDDFASSVDISGDIIVVGAKARFNTAGAAYVYRNSRNRRMLQETDPTVGDFVEDVELFDDSTGDLEVGESVAVDGNTIAVTSPFRSQSGVVYLLQADDVPLATDGPTVAPTLSPTVSPTTSAPTLSPTATGPLSGGGCNMTSLLYIDCQGTGAAMVELGGTTNITNPPDETFCVELCRLDSECVAVTYDYTDPANPVCRFVGDITTTAFTNNVQCHQKDIPCVPTVAPTVAPTITGATLAPTSAPTASPTVSPTDSPSASPTKSPTAPPTLPAVQCNYVENIAVVYNGYPDPNYPDEVEVGTNIAICQDLCSSSVYCVGVNYQNNFCRLFGYIEDNSTDVLSRSFLKDDPLCQTQAVPTRFPTASPSATPTRSPTAPTTGVPTGTPTNSPTVTQTVSPTPPPTLTSIPCLYNVTQDLFCTGGNLNSTLTGVVFPLVDCKDACNLDTNCILFTHNIDTCNFYTNGTVTTEVGSTGATCHVKISGCGLDSLAPTAAPSATPTASPTGEPTGTPTASPTGTPTSTPTGAPTDTPTVAPTGSPTGPTTTNSPTLKFILRRRDENFITTWPPIVLAITYTVAAFAATVAIVLRDQFIIPQENVIFRIA